MWLRFKHFSNTCFLMLLKQEAWFKTEHDNWCNRSWIIPWFPSCVSPHLYHDIDVFILGHMQRSVSLTPCYCPIQFPLSSGQLWSWWGSACQLWYDGESATSYQLAWDRAGTHHSEYWQFIFLGAYLFAVEYVEITWRLYMSETSKLHKVDLHCLCTAVVLKN